MAARNFKEVTIMGGLGLGGGVNIVVAPQINLQLGLNLAVLSPGAVQTLAQVGGNNLAVAQGRR
jgi:hypothetical protein